MQIIPALIVHDDDAKNDFEELKSRFSRIQPILASLGGWIQLDITDGKFVPAMTYLMWDEIRFFTQAAQVDLHLMVQNPETMIDKWIVTKPARITFHIEATKKPEEIIAACRAAGVGVGIALNPETPFSSIQHLTLDIDLLLFLGVRPGRGGQAFIPEVMEKIKSLSTSGIDLTHVKIGVDGGVNGEIARALKSANVDVIMVGDYLFSSDDISSRVVSLR